MNRQPSIIPTSQSGHPLAGTRRPVSIAVVILIGVLAAMGWTDAQIVAVLVVVLPIGAIATLEPRR